MIKQLNISNFQSHKDTSLVFDKGVNVIVGATDSGKTAIIRALRWLIWNRPSGEAFRSHWGGETKVKLTFENDLFVIRSKDSQNKYIYNGTTSMAFGQSVPEEIQRALNMDEINLQMQFDQPFLLTSTPGEVARHFNTISKLDTIDVSIKSIKSNIRELEGEIKHDTQRETDLKEELKQYDDLDKFEAELEVLEDVEEKRNKLSKDISEIEHLKTQAEELMIESAAIAETLKMKPEVDALLAQYADLREKENEYDALHNLVLEIKDLDQQLFQVEALVRDKENVDSIIALIEKKNNLVEEYKELRRYRMELRDLQNALQDIGLEIRDLKETFHREMPEVCPLCGK